MEGNIRHTFPKVERLCGKTSISYLLAKGKYGNAGILRYRWVVKEDNDCSRIVVSVPKKLFKRAVKRNLLKRRIRESWRKQKHLIENVKIDILISYATKECVDYLQIEEVVNQIIIKINKTIETSPTAKIENENGN